MSVRKFHLNQRKEMARTTHASWMLCVLQLCWEKNPFLEDLELFEVIVVIS